MHSPSENTVAVGRMKYLNDILSTAARKYYAEGNEIMSNARYDELYDELVKLEKDYSIILDNSITQRVGYEVVSSLNKVKHDEKMLSLNKTKDQDELKKWLGGRKGCLSWKLDGLTCVLTYNDGKLIKAVTRGNGEIGEDITFNAIHFKGIPHQIPIKEKVVIRGEALIRYSDFEKINKELDADAQYKNPRNLCSGTVRQLDSSILKDRTVNFYAFNFIEGVSENSFSKRLDILMNIGFQVVQYYIVDKDNIIQTMEYMKNKIEHIDVPSDGLVLMYDDVEYIKSLGNTAKFPKGGMAFKWNDETVETILRDVEWSPSRTGSLNPVAIFDTVEIEGTDVSRASLHNVSIIRDLKLGIGDSITVYKANMIIPQVKENLTCSNDLEIPVVCPVCNSRTEIKIGNDNTQVLCCSNPECDAKVVGKFVHFAERDCMNIVGLSEATISKFVKKGFIKDYADIYHLDNYKSKIINMDGFGTKSYMSIITSIENSRKVNAENLISALGITGVGKTIGMVLFKHFKDVRDLVQADIRELKKIDGIGEVMAHDIYEYFQDEANRSSFNSLLNELNVEMPSEVMDSNITGKTFVITGSVEKWKNRNELKSYILSIGGKVSDSVTSKTDYLINNDNTSNSSKNKKAKDLGVQIITENEFLLLVE